MVCLLRGMIHALLRHRERGSESKMSSESTFNDDVTTWMGWTRGIRAALTKVHRRLMNDGRGARTVTVEA